MAKREIQNILYQSSDLRGYLLCLGSFLSWLAIYTSVGLLQPENLALGGWLSFLTVIPLVVVPAVLGVLPGILTAAAVIGTAAVFRLGTGVGNDLDPALIRMLRVLILVIPVATGAVSGSLTRLQRAVEYERLAQREANHRIKNSLALTASALSLIRSSVEDERANQALVKAQSQVETIASVHETLALQNSYNHIELKEYLKRIADHVSEVAPDHPEVEVTGEPIRCESRLAVACGLIVNELSLNAIKHGPTQRPDNWICTRLQLCPVDNGRWIELRVEHPSSTLPPDFSLERSSGLGISIVHALVRQHEGSWKVLNMSPATFLMSMRNEQSEQ